jgi:hypothetical protein
MPIYRLLRGHAFGPEEIKILGDAFEDALRTLRLVNRDDPATEIVAKKIICGRPPSNPYRRRAG